MRSLSKNVYQGSKKNENKGLEEINMRSLSKNVKKDSQENVYQGSNKNENKGWEEINMRNLSKNEKMQIRDRRKLICEVCRKTSKKTLRKTFIRGPPYNAYNNSKNIDNELDYYPLLSTKNPKIDNQEYVNQGSPLLCL